MENSREITLLKDSEWSVIDSIPCRVINFIPFASIESGKIKNAGLSMPYCSIEIECKELPEKANGFITHKIDFINLWRVFKDRGLKEEEEVIIYWTTKNYKNKFLKHFSGGMPKILVWICRKKAFEALNDKNYNGLSSEQWFDFIRPLEEYRPDVMQ